MTKKQKRYNHQWQTTDPRKDQRELKNFGKKRGLQRNEGGQKTKRNDYPRSKGRFLTTDLRS